MPNAFPMRQLLKHVSLLLLLLLAQQGAVVHELSHVSEARSTQIQSTSDIAEATCALCAVFAQTITPAVSHSFHIPLLTRTAFERSNERLYQIVGTAVPTPRSRGPPSKI